MKATRFVKKRKKKVCVAKMKNKIFWENERKKNEMRSSYICSIAKKKTKRYSFVTHHLKRMLK